MAYRENKNQGGSARSRLGFYGIVNLEVAVPGHESTEDKDMGTGAWHTGRTRVADYGRIDRHVVAAFLDYLEPHGGRAWLWENREEVRKTPFRGWDILFAKVEFNAKISIPDHYVEDFEQERIVDLALCDAEMCH